MVDKAPAHGGVREKALEELKAFWMVALYLAVFLGAFTWYRRLVLAEFGVTYYHYGIALIEALIIAKVILIGKAFGLGRRFEGSALMLSVIFKSVTSGLFVFLFGILEHVVEGLFHRKDWASIWHGLIAVGMDEILARTIVMMIAFIPFFAFCEIGRVLGPRRLWALFFAGRSSRSKHPQ